MVATVRLGPLGPVASLLAATIYDGTHEMNHKSLNILRADRYILYMQVLLECCYIQTVNSQWEINRPSLSVSR